MSRSPLVLVVVAVRTVCEDPVTIIVSILALGPLLATSFILLEGGVDVAYLTELVVRWKLDDWRAWEDKLVQNCIAASFCLIWCVIAFRFFVTVSKKRKPIGDYLRGFILHWFLVGSPFAYITLAPVTAGAHDTKLTVCMGLWNGFLVTVIQGSLVYSALNRGIMYVAMRPQRIIATWVMILIYTVVIIATLQLNDALRVLVAKARCSISHLWSYLQNKPPISRVCVPGIALCIIVILSHTAWVFVICYVQDQNLVYFFVSSLCASLLFSDWTVKYMELNKRLVLPIAVTLTCTWFLLGSLLPVSPLDKGDAL